MSIICYIIHHFRRKHVLGGEGRGGKGGGKGGGGGDFSQWGAVPVSPTNIFRLLQRGDMVLLFPGGLPEAGHGPGDNYKLFWSEKTDFVRVAALGKVQMGSALMGSLQIVCFCAEVFFGYSPLTPR